MWICTFLVWAFLGKEENENKRPKKIKKYIFDIFFSLTIRFRKRKPLCGAEERIGSYSILSTTPIVTQVNILISIISKCFTNNLLQFIERSAIDTWKK